MCIHLRLAYFISTLYEFFDYLLKMDLALEF